MAVPTVQREPGQHPQSSRTAKFVLWLWKLGAAAGRPLFAVLLALIASGIVIMITSPGDLGTRFSTVINAFQALYAGSFGDTNSISSTLVRVGPLILAGLSVSIAFRAGLFNIGAAGQIAVGAMTAGIIGFTAQGLPSWLLIPLMILGSMLAGAIWGGIVGILKAWRGAHEVVTTIMLNWIAFYITDYLISGPFKAPNQSSQTPQLPPQATLPSISLFYNTTLGTFLPKIANPDSYRVDVSFFLALLALVVYWFITSRTTFGYEIRVLGQNLKAARYAGIPIKRNLFLVMALSGAFAGLAGSLRLMGQFPYTLIGSTFSIDSTGFDAIGVSLLGRTTSIGVLLSSLLFGGLRQGGGIMQLSAGIPGDLVYIIQALVLFSIAAEFLPALQRALPSWARLRRRPALVPDLAGITAVDLVLDQNGTAVLVNGEHKTTSSTSDIQAGTDTATSLGEES